MPSLYNCKHSGDQYRVTKFDSDWNVEASYLCDLHNCDCPAGHRPSCRHREMLPKFLHREYVDSIWFFDHDRGGWVQGASKELDSDFIASDKAMQMPNDLGDEYLRGIMNREEFQPQDEDLEPAGLGQGQGDYWNGTPQSMEDALEADGEKLRQLTGEDHGPVFLADEPSPLLGGFPYDCYDTLCTTPTDCIINGCVRGNGTPPRRLEPSPSPPSPTIRRRV